MQEDFKVSITGDVSGLKKAVGDAEKELSAFASKSRELTSAINENIAISERYDKAIIKLEGAFKKSFISQTVFTDSLAKLKSRQNETTIATDNLKNELINLQREAAGLPKIMPQVGNAFKGVDKTGSMATNTMMEFSRVVQQAPSGISNVGDNIVQLVSSFGSLQKSTGSAGAAFKAMASSLMGPAGILLAVSLVTSLLVQYGDKLFSTKTKTEKLREETEKATKAVDEFIQSLTGLETVDLNVRIKIAQEKNTASVLFKQLQSGATAALRQGALDALKQKYPNLFEGALKSVTITTAKAGDLSKIIQHIETQGKEMTRSLEAKKEFDDNIEGAEKLNAQIIQFEKNVKTTKNEYEKLKKIYNEKGGQENWAAMARAFKDFDSAVTNAKGIPKIKKEIEKINEENLRLNAQITLTVDEPSIEKVKTDIEKTGKTDPIRLPATIDFEVSKTGFQQLEQTFKDKFGRPIPSDQFKLLDNLPIIVGEMNSEIANLIGNIKNMLPTDIWGNLNVPPDLFANLNKMSAEELTIFINNLDKTILASDIFNQAIGSAFNALTSSIAKSMETDSELVNAFVGSIINSMGALLTSLITTAITNLAIKETVATGNAVLAGTESAAAAGPAAIWVMPAMIAAGVAMVGAAFASIGGFAGGGIVPGGSFNGDKVPAFVNSGEMILNSGQQGNLFDILDGNLRKLGGQSQMQTIRVEGSLRGQTMLLQNKRSEKESNRFYGRK